MQQLICFFFLIFIDIYIYVYKINWNNTLEYDYAGAITAKKLWENNYLFVWH